MEGREVREGEEEGRAEEKRTALGEVPQEQRKTRDPGGPRQGRAARAVARRKVSPAPTPLLCPPGASAQPHAPRGPARPGASPPERCPIDRAGPAPSRADWLPPRWPRLINKFSGEPRPDPEPAGAPENSACAAAPADNQARSARAGLLGRGGRRARWSPPGLGPGRSQRPTAILARPKLMPGGWPELRLEGGPGSAWPRLLT